MWVRGICGVREFSRPSLSLINLTPGVDKSTGPLHSRTRHIVRENLTLRTYQTQRMDGGSEFDGGKLGFTVVSIPVSVVIVSTRAPAENKRDRLYKTTETQQWSGNDPWLAVMYGPTPLCTPLDHFS